MHTGYFLQHSRSKLEIDAYPAPGKPLCQSAERLSLAVHNWNIVLCNGCIPLLYRPHLHETDQKNQIALRASEENYRQLFQINPHPMLVFNLNTLRILAVIIPQFPLQLLQRRIP